MNATRTTPRQALARWQRAIVRAVLLVGALAGMTLVSAAHAQIAFRSSTSAFISGGGPAIPALRAAAAGGPPITIVGESRAPATDDAFALQISAPITPPSGMQANDVVLVFISANVPSTTTITNCAGAAAGQTWISRGNQVGSNPTQKIYGATFNGSWSGTPNIPAFCWGSTAATYQIWMVVLRGVDTSHNTNLNMIDGSCCTGANDASATFAAPASPFDVTIPASSFTTSTDNAMVFAQWHSADNNTWTLQTPGWSSLGGQPQWRTMEKADGTGTKDSSSSIAYLTQATAGPVAAVTNRQASPVASPPSDAGVWRMFAVRPAGIRKPPGTVAGDVMIATIAFSLSTSTITPPAGWTLVRRIDGSSYSLAIYRRVADASDASVSSYTFVSLATNGWVGGIQSFSGVDTTNPIVVDGGQVTASSTTHATPSGLTTGAVANTLLVTTHMVNRGSITGWTPPAGMTATLDFHNGKAIGQAMATSTVLQAAAGAIGTKTATIAGGTGYAGAAHILALRPAAGGAGSNTLTITKPAGVVQNDVMIASISVGPSTATITPPSGNWALVRRTDNASGTSNSLAVYKLLAGASEPASYDWTFSAGHTGAAGGIMAFSGADPVLVETDSGVNTASGTAHATPSVTTALSKTMIITSHGAGAATTTWTPPSGMTEAVDANGGSAALEMNYVLQGTAGPSGAKSATSSTTATGNAHILALRRVLGNFNAFETSTVAGATGGVIKTKVAGSTVSLATISKNAASNAVATTFVGTVKVEVLNASDNSGALDAVTGCRSTWTLIQALSPDTTFAAADNGRKNISFSVPGSYRDVRLRMTSPPAGGPDVIIGCSNDNFAIRPDQFINVQVNDNDWETANTSGPGRPLSNIGLGGTVHKAGRPFTVRATAVNSDGTTTTANYTGTPTATLTDCGGNPACIDSGFGTLTIGASFVGGQLTSHAATYSDVGSFDFQLVDSTYADVDLADSSAFEREIKQLVVFDVGRFVPDHFAVELSPPTLQPSFAAACPAGNFTYVGQSFSYSTPPVIKVTAQNFSNATTPHYTGQLWRITNLSLTKSYSAASGTVVEATGGTDPVIQETSGSPGVGTVSFTSGGTSLSFQRSNTPLAPFNADISLAINVVDADNVVYASNPWLVGQASAGNGIAFNSNAKSMRFGRLALKNANGSQLVRLPVQLETQYWNGTAFITNDADNCTTLATNNAAMSNFTSNLAACETANTAVSAFARGRSILTLAAPGSGNNGSVDLAVNLGLASSGTTCTSVGGGTVPAAGANRAYLQGNWTGGAYNVNPSARATFGVYKGSEEVIFIRENF